MTTEDIQTDWRNLLEKHEPIYTLIKDKVTLSPQDLLVDEEDWKDIFDELGLAGQKRVIVKKLLREKKGGIVPQGKFKAVSAKSNEGVNVHSKTAVLTRRQPTIEGMLKLLWKRRLLFAKGPPFSGKTSLANLCAQSLEDQLEIDTIFISFGTAPDNFDFSQFWEEQTGKSWNATLLPSGNRQTVLIIDEVQVTYVHGNKSPLWTLVKNMLQAKYPHIALLMFGAYGGGLQEFDQLATPVQIPDDYVMLLTPQADKPGILATEAEFDELITKHETKYNFKIGDEPKIYIKHITSLHLGLVKYILKYIKCNIANQDARDSERDKNIMLVLRSSRFYRGVLDNGRSFPELDLMDNNMLATMGGK